MKPKDPPQSFRLKSFEFRRERESQWRELEDLVARVEQRGLERLDPSELERLPVLYRAAVSSLSVARSISLDKNVVDYLDGLCTRAYFAVYCRRRPFWSSIARFFDVTFPSLVRSMRWALLISTLCFIGGSLCGYALVLDEPDRFYNLVDESMASGRDPVATKDELADSLASDGGGVESMTHFASFLFTHNAKIGLMCFALGFAAGVPVILLLFLNGLMLGAMTAVFGMHDLGLDFIAWVLPHGITEILAVCLCGAAGLSVGYGVVFPGAHSRLHNLAVRGRRAAAVAVGAVLLFFIAALLEGFFRQLVHSTDTRVMVATLTAFGWLAYFGFVGRNRDTDEVALAPLRHAADSNALAAQEEIAAAARAGAYPSSWRGSR